MKDLLFMWVSEGRGLELEKEEEINADGEKKKVDEINARHGNLLEQCAC